MPGFKFELAQLVWVPGQEGQQGRIAGRTEFLDGESQYFVKWLDETLTVRNGLVSESDLVKAQRPASETVASLQVKIEADTEEFHKGVRAAIGSLQELNAVATPEAVAALKATARRRRPTRSTPEKSSRRKAKRKGR